MNGTVNTDTSDLYELKAALESFAQSTQYLQLVSENMLCDFDNALRAFEYKLGEENNCDFEDFKIMHHKYENARDLFSEQLSRLLQHKLVTAEGQKNIYTLISIIEKYQNL